MFDTVKQIAKKKHMLRKWLVKSEELAEKWIREESKQKSRTIVQRGIYLATLGENIGGEMNTNPDYNEERPVLVISNNIVNTNNSNVIIVPLTSTIKTVERNGKIVPRVRSHYILSKLKYQFLSNDSTIKTEQIRTVSKVRLSKMMGMIDEEDYKRVKTRINTLID